MSARQKNQHPPRSQRHHQTYGLAWLDMAGVNLCGASVVMMWQLQSIPFWPSRFSLPDAALARTSEASILSHIVSAKLYRSA